MTTKPFRDDARGIIALEIFKQARRMRDAAGIGRRGEDRQFILRKGDLAFAALEGSLIDHLRLLGQHAGEQIGRIHRAAGRGAHRSAHLKALLLLLGKGHGTSAGQHRADANSGHGSFLQKITSGQVSHRSLSFSSSGFLRILSTEHFSCLTKLYHSLPTQKV